METRARQQKVADDEVDKQSQLVVAAVDKSVTVGCSSNSTEISRAKSKSRNAQITRSSAVTFGCGSNATKIARAKPKSRDDKVIISKNELRLKNEKLANAKKELQTTKMELTRLQQENIRSKEEMRKQRMDYKLGVVEIGRLKRENQQKTQEIEQLKKEMDTMQNQLKKVTVDYIEQKNHNNAEMNSAKAMIITLTRNLEEIGVLISKDLRVSRRSYDGTLDSRFRHVRKYIVKLKNKVQNLVQKHESMKKQLTEANVKNGEFEQKMTEAKRLTSDIESLLHF